jgi:hypothetical protein
MTSIRLTRIGQHQVEDPKLPPKRFIHGVVRIQTLEGLLEGSGDCTIVRSHSSERLDSCCGFHPALAIHPVRPFRFALGLITPSSRPSARKRPSRFIVALGVRHSQRGTVPAKRAWTAQVSPPESRRGGVVFRILID